MIIKGNLEIFNINRKPLVLIVDDAIVNLQVVGKMLDEKGYDVSLADSGYKALDMLKELRPDIILLDIMMPGLNGFDVCVAIKKIKELKHIPIIFLTAQDNSERILKGFRLGGVDYILKPFEEDILLTRIKTHLELKFSQEKIENHIEEINKANNKLRKVNKDKDKYLSQLNTELENAAEYVISLLPDSIKKGRILTDWLFYPSAQLGGDSFGYRWLDKENFAIYLLDVCYHGIGPALMSVSILNDLRHKSLSKIDFKEPSQVLCALNKNYQMTEHNDMFFSIFYAVYNATNGVLKYATAGHPPALLIDENGNDYKLSSKNIVIGAVENYKFKSLQIEIPTPSKLYIFSDGVYEIEQKNGKRWTIDEFYKFITQKSLEYWDEKKSLDLESVFEHVNTINKRRHLQDDFSILRISFSQ